MIKQISAKNIQLVEVIDLRPIDFQSGKRLAIPVEACNICDRCEKKHVKVYVVFADGDIYNVGSTCCKRLFGWEPEKADLQKKEKAEKEKALQAALKKATQDFLDTINALECPKPVYKYTQTQLDYSKIAVYHADGVIVASEPNKVALSPAKLADFEKRWRAKKLDEALKVYAAEFKSKQAKQLVSALTPKKAK